MSKRFRVAFSFSAEKRAFIAEVARILAGRFGSDRIFYDKYHEAELARSDLGLYLSAIYHDQTDLVVVALSNRYDRKEWCGLEWAAIYPRVRKGEWGSVMLFRWDRVEGAGLYGVEGLIDLDTRTPEQAASLILERLALQEGHPADYYARATIDVEWPEVAPPLEWLVADLNEARRAFSRLITRNAAFRLLLVEGPSETGKTVLAKQCLASALKIPGLRCGLFDFKGGPDWLHLASQLEVPAPEGGNISAQLAHVLSALGRTPRPTLLIFDTFELAGEAGRWILESLLPRASRAPWLRIVIAGQCVPAGRAEPWSSLSARLKLAPPSAQDWFEYAKPHHRDLTLDFVRRAHEFSGGRSAVLAQLLGPS